MFDMEFMEWLEISLRVISALTLTVAMLYILIGLHLCGLRPKLVWRYVGAVVGLTALWRWVVVALYAEHHLPGLAAELGPWVNPISAAITCLIGVAFLVLTYASNRKRAGDE